MARGNAARRRRRCRMAAHSAASGNFLPRTLRPRGFEAGNSHHRALGCQWSARKTSWHSSCFRYPSRSIYRMFDNIFGIHEQALLLHGQRIGVLATNLANADTPNYKARDIDFSDVLAHTSEASLPMRATQAAHIVVGSGELAGGDLKYRNPYQASLDGNTVEMPIEQAAFSENNVRYQASLNFINLRISELQLAIAGQ